MYPGLYSEHVTGDSAYDKAFAALADCPSFAQVEQALKTYAHELAEKIRANRVREPEGEVEEHLNWALDSIANEIDPEKEGQ